MTTASASPETIRAAYVRLSAAREVLAERPRERTLEALGALLDRFAEPDSAPRKQLEGELPRATGFHASTVKEGLARALPKFTSGALRALVSAEREAAPDARFEGFRRTGVLLAGAVPMPTLTSLVLPLLLHSPVLAKTSSRDPITARVFAESLEDLDPELGRCIEVVSFPSDDVACSDALLGVADCVVATGSDETIHAIRARTKATTRFVGYGHRLSLAMVGPEALAGPALADVARRLARDIALWDQQGCLSPVAIFCEGDRASARALGEALFHALEAAEASWPRGDLEPEAAAAIRRERDEALMRRADERDVSVFASSGTKLTVIVEDELLWRDAPLHRFVRIYAALERAELLRAIRRVAEHLAAVSIEGFGRASPDLARALTRLGASRICEPGTMQAPPLDWHHDGQLLLAPLARLADISDAFANE